MESTQSESGFGRFRDLVPLGEGGMGKIFLARAIGPGGFVKPVVLKRMHESLTRDASLVERFLREARIQARLSCPNIIQVLDFGRMEGTYFLVMEYVHGIDLSQLVRARERLMPIGVAARVALDVCRGLDHAHRARDDSGKPLHLVHRDLSPQNVLVSYEGDVKLCDFGLARVGEPQAGEPGVVYGKPAYLAPELPLGQAVDGRSDLYSLGLVLYYALTGIEPLRGSTRAETLARVAAAAIDPVELLRPEVPAGLASLTRRALHPSVEHRFPDAAAMLAELETSALELGPDATTSALRELVAGTFPGAADTDPWAKRTSGSPLELRRLVAEDGITELAIFTPSSRKVSSATSPGTIAHAVGADVSSMSSTRARRRRAVLAALATLLVVSGAAVAVSLRHTESERPPPDAKAARDRSPTVRAPRVSTAPSAQVSPSTEPTAHDPHGRPQTKGVTSPSPRGAGKLRVGVAPGWGWVYVDGRKVGATPLQIDVRAGRRNVRVVGGLSGRSERRMLEISDGQTMSLFLEPFE